MNAQTFIFLVLVVLALPACRSKTDTTAGQQVEEPVVRIKTSRVSEQIVEFPVRVSGFVVSRSEAKPSFKVGGVIKRTFVDEGDMVLKGQLLATLNMTEINAQLAQTDEGLNKARRDLQRVRNLYADSVATLEQVQNAETALRLAEHTRAIAGFNQQYAEVRAPMDGKVLRKFMTDGEVAGPGIPVFYILGNTASDWRIRVGVTDRDWARIKQGDRASVQFDAFPGQVFEGAVQEIAQAADPKSSTFDVEIQLTGKSPRLAAGLVASVELFPETRGKSLLIPVDALIHSDAGRGVVFLIDDSLRAWKTYVSIQAISGAGVILGHGLKPGDQVATTGGAFLENGSKVSIIE